MDPRWDFFIAHSGNDSGAAEELFLHLSAQAKPYLDTKNMLLGEDWDISLRTAQRQSRITVVLISRHSDEAYYQRDEIAAAVAYARRDPSAHRVVPVYLEGFPAPDALLPPYGIRLKHGLAVTEQTPMSEIANRLLELLGNLDEYSEELVLASRGSEVSGPPISPYHYSIDICFCIDGSLSMESKLRRIRREVLTIPYSLKASMNLLQKEISKIRVRFVVFGPDPRRVIETSFLELEREGGEILETVSRLGAAQGAGSYSDGLAALRAAITSDWTRTETRSRHIIFLWSNTAPPPSNPSVLELTNMWEDSTQMDYSAKRLVLFTPAEGAWDVISELWSNVVLFESDAGTGLTIDVSDEIFSEIVRSV
jgi:hypothetical protein